MKLKKVYWIIPTLFLLVTKILQSDEGIFKIHGYSSDEWEDEEFVEKPEKVYYYWQIESLKKAISPRYIRLVDIQKYLQTTQFMNKGYIFTYQGLKNKFVSICGNFTNWECIPMRKNNYGIFYIVIDSPTDDEKYQPFTRFQYKFLVDGLYVPDPTNEFQELDSTGSYISIYYPEDKDINPFAKVEVLEDSNIEESDLRTVEFKIYLPDKDTVTIVGDFNQWDLDSDFLYKTKDGYFQKRMKLRPGKYYYKFIADGEPILDTYNPNVKIRYPFEYEVSELIVPERKSPLERK